MIVLLFVLLAACFAAAFWQGLAVRTYTEKTDKVKAAGGKKFPACGLYEWIFCLGCLFAILEKYQMVAISFPCAITKTQKITIYYVEKVGGMLRSSQIMIKFAAICNAEFAK